MRNVLLSLFLFPLLILPLVSAETPKDPYRMFPSPEEGVVRYVIEVPKQSNESDYRVELLVGKEMLADCNLRGLNGKVEKKPLKGWGYSYYSVSDIQQGPHTMMICNEPAKERFVAMHFPKLLRYNSRLGTVVYVPKGYEVRYRIWQADAKMHQAVQR